VKEQAERDKIRTAQVLFFALASVSNRNRIYGN
jgi:hypothetical protein